MIDDYLTKRINDYQHSAQKQELFPEIEKMVNKAKEIQETYQCAHTQGYKLTLQDERILETAQELIFTADIIHNPGVLDNILDRLDDRVVDEHGGESGA